MHNKTLKELSTLLHSKQVSSTELTRHYLDRIAASQHNAFLHVDADLSLAQAKAADARRADGLAGPLTGIPIAHKDNICTRGVRTTSGSKIFENFVPDYDAEIVSQLNDAGANMVGVLENLTGAYISPAYKEGVALMLFLVVIIFKPEGLLGKTEERKV